MQWFSAARSTLNTLHDSLQHRHWLEESLTNVRGRLTHFTQTFMFILCSKLLFMMKSQMWDCTRSQSQQLLRSRCAQDDVFETLTYEGRCFLWLCVQPCAALCWSVTKLVSILFRYHLICGWAKLWSRQADAFSLNVATIAHPTCFVISSSSLIEKSCVVWSWTVVGSSLECLLQGQIRCMDHHMLEAVFDKKFLRRITVFLSLT